MLGRTLAGQGDPGDDGAPDPGVRAALDAYAAGRGSEHAALTALATSRLLVPVVALLTDAEPGFIAAYGQELQARFGQRFNPTAQIGDATGIEFLPGGLLEAAAEPVRRGGGDAEVVSPQTSQ